MSAAMSSSLSTWSSSFLTYRSTSSTARPTAISGPLHHLIERYDQRMNANTLLDEIAKYFGAFVFAGTGIGAISFWIFKLLGTKWVDARFAERLQTLRSQQDEAIRHVQSAIDREVHRAKKLYDSEFTALSECWRLLRDAYDQSVGTIASFTANVDRSTHEELERFLTKVGMEEWQRNEMKAKEGKQRQDAYHQWAEWGRYKKVDALWRQFRSLLDANSIFFADGFAERFREIEQLIIASNVEYEDRVRYHGTSDSSAYNFDETNKLRKEGDPKMKELEDMVRKRLWSVARDADQKG